MSLVSFFFKSMHIYKVPSAQTARKTTTAQQLAETASERSLSDPSGNCSTQWLHIFVDALLTSSNVVKETRGTAVTQPHISAGHHCHNISPTCKVDGYEPRLRAVNGISAVYWGFGFRQGVWEPSPLSQMLCK